MIKKLVRQMLLAQIISALTVSLCLLIDNIMIGRFLGENALTAYGLANPVLMMIGAVGSMLCAGVQVVCSRSLGHGLKEETDAGYSTAIAVAALFSAVFSGLRALLKTPFSRTQLPLFFLRLFRFSVKRAEAFGQWLSAFCRGL